MNVVVVEHFLNDQGVVYFSTWLKEIRKVLLHFDGFIELERLKDIQEPHRCILILRLKSESLLNKWSGSKVHNEKLGLLAPYTLRKYIAKKYICSRILQ